MSAHCRYKTGPVGVKSYTLKSYGNTGPLMGTLDPSPPSFDNQKIPECAQFVTKHQTAQLALLSACTRGKLYLLVYLGAAHIQTFPTLLAKYINQMSLAGLVWKLEPSTAIRTAPWTGNNELASNTLICHSLAELQLLQNNYNLG